MAWYNPNEWPKEVQGSALEFIAAVGMAIVAWALSDKRPIDVGKATIVEPERAKLNSKTQ